MKETKHKQRIQSTPQLTDTLIGRNPLMPTKNNLSIFPFENSILNIVDRFSPSKMPAN